MFLKPFTKFLLTSGLLSLCRCLTSTRDKQSGKFFPSRRLHMSLDLSWPVQDHLEKSSKALTVSRLIRLLRRRKEFATHFAKKVKSLVKNVFAFPTPKFLEGGTGKNWGRAMGQVPTRIRYLNWSLEQIPCILYTVHFYQYTDHF